MSDRKFQVGDKVTMFGAGPVWCKAEVAEIDRGGFRPIRVIWGANKAHTTDFHSSELTLVEPVKQWRPLPEGIKFRDGYFCLTGWGAGRTYFSVSRAADFLELRAVKTMAIADSARELRDHWDEYEETQGMEQ